MTRVDRAEANPDAHRRDLNAGSIEVRSLVDTARDRLVEQLASVWGSTVVARLGQALDAARLPGFGMTFGHIEPDGVCGSRRIKPSSPDDGRDGIPISDEIVLELPMRSERTRP